MKSSFYKKINLMTWNNNLIILLNKQIKMKNKHVQVINIIKKISKNLKNKQNKKIMKNKC